LSDGVELGAASVPTVSATLNFQGSHGLEEQLPLWGVGAEIALVQAVFVHWGRQTDDDRHQSISMWGAGIGLPKGRTYSRLEYANSPMLDNRLAPNVDHFGFTFIYLFDGR
jgi:hypothetical protein